MSHTDVAIKLLQMLPLKGTVTENETAVKYHQYLYSQEKRRSSSYEMEETSIN
jgi:hypothetical protein